MVLPQILWIRGSIQCLGFKDNAYFNVRLPLVLPSLFVPLDTNLLWEPYHLLVSVACVLWESCMTMIYLPVFLYHQTMELVIAGLPSDSLDSVSSLQNKGVFVVLTLDFRNSCYLVSSARISGQASAKGFESSVLRLGCFQKPALYRLYRQTQETRVVTLQRALALHMLILKLASSST